MTYEEAKKTIHVRSAMFRRSNPDVKYWKNSSKFAHIDAVTSAEDKAATDWMEHDPRESAYEAMA